MIEPNSKNLQLVLKDEERQLCEVYTRVMGYIRPASEFNKGKQGEYRDRVCFNEIDLTN